MRPLSAPPKRPPVGHGSKRCPARAQHANAPPQGHHLHGSCESYVSPLLEAPLVICCDCLWLFVALAFRGTPAPLSTILTYICSESSSTVLRTLWSSAPRSPNRSRGSIVSKFGTVPPTYEAKRFSADTAAFLACLPVTGRGSFGRRRQPEASFSCTGIQARQPSVNITVPNLSGSWS